MSTPPLPLFRLGEWKCKNTKPYLGAPQYFFVVILLDFKESIC